MEIVAIILVGLFGFIILKTYVFSNEEDKCFRRIWGMEKANVFQEETATYKRLYNCFDINFGDNFSDKKVKSLTAAAVRFDLEKNQNNLGIMVAPIVLRKLKRDMGNNNRTADFERLFPSQRKSPLPIPTPQKQKEPTYEHRNHLELAPNVWVSTKPEFFSKYVIALKALHLLDSDVLTSQHYRRYPDGNEPFTKATRKFRDLLENENEFAVRDLTKLILQGIAGPKNSNGQVEYSRDLALKWCRRSATDEYGVGTVSYTHLTLPTKA